MRLQARAYILAHGGNPDAMGEDDLKLVTVALADGLIGNRQVLTTLGSLTAGVFNYLRSQGQTAYTLEGILTSVHDYIYPPLTDEQKQKNVNDRLMAYMMSMPNSKGKL